MSIQSSTATVAETKIKVAQKPSAVTLDRNTRGSLMYQGGTDIAGLGSALSVNTNLIETSIKEHEFTRKPSKQWLLHTKHLPVQTDQYYSQLKIINEHVRTEQDENPSPFRHHLRDTQSSFGPLQKTEIFGKRHMSVPRVRNGQLIKEINPNNLVLGIDQPLSPTGFPIHNKLQNQNTTLQSSKKQTSQIFTNAKIIANRESEPHHNALMPTTRNKTLAGSGGETFKNQFQFASDAASTFRQAQEGGSQRSVMGDVHRPKIGDDIKQISFMDKPQGIQKGSITIGNNKFRNTNMTTLNSLKSSEDQQIGLQNGIKIQTHTVQKKPYQPLPKMRSSNSPLHTTSGSIAHQQNNATDETAVATSPLNSQVLLTNMKTTRNSDVKLNESFHRGRKEAHSSFQIQPLTVTFVPAQAKIQGPHNYEVGQDQHIQKVHNLSHYKQISDKNRNAAKSAINTYSPTKTYQEQSQGTGRDSGMSVSSMRTTNLNFDTAQTSPSKQKPIQVVKKDSGSMVEEKFITNAFVGNRKMTLETQGLTEIESVQQFETEGIFIPGVTINDQAQQHSGSYATVTMTSQGRQGAVADQLNFQSSKRLSIHRKTPYEEISAKAIGYGANRFKEQIALQNAEINKNSTLQNPHAQRFTGSKSPVGKLGAIQRTHNLTKFARPSAFPQPADFQRQLFHHQQQQEFAQLQHKMQEEQTLSHTNLGLMKSALKKHSEVKEYDLQVSEVKLQQEEDDPVESEKTLEISLEGGFHLPMIQEVKNTNEQDIDIMAARRSPIKHVVIHKELANGNRFVKRKRKSQNMALVTSKYYGEVEGNTRIQSQYI